MTIFRGPGGGGNATSDSEVNILTTLTNQALVYSEQAGLEADAAAASAAAASGSAFDANSSAVASAASETQAALSESAAALSASNTSTSETNAANSASAAAASAASINDDNLVHKTGNETIGGIKTFSSTIVGSVSGNAATVTTNAPLTGMVTSAGNTTTVVTNASLTGAVTSVGNTTSLGSFTSAQLTAALTDETGSGSNVFATSPTLVTPALGTPSALIGTNISGTASALSIGGNAATATAFSGVVGSAPSYACRAWVNFNGTGTVAIRASGNVSSITDNGVGDYTVNFATAMPDANYSPSFGAQYTVGDGLDSPRIGIKRVADSMTTSALRVVTPVNDSVTPNDALVAAVSIFR